MTELELVRARLRTNPEQWKAFRAPGHCVVIAPPGSGKTELLTARLAQDFVDEIPAPHGAACITYSNPAAGELSRRLGRLGVERRSNLFVGTVHSFAWTQIVRPFAPLVGREYLLEAKVATEAAQDEAFEVARQAVFGAEDPYGLRSTMDRRRKLITLDDVSDDRFGGELDAALAIRYGQELEAHGLVDFDDMVRIAVELVDQFDFVRRVLVARFSKLYVDEYQDLGPGLHELVLKLCFRGAGSATLFAVADPDQCIYVFSGADPRLVQELADRDDVSGVRLKRNYRSADEIIQASVNLLPEPIEVFGEGGGGVLEVHQVDGKVEGQALATVPILETAMQTSRPEDLALICLTNDDCVEAADVLIDAGLPVFVRRKGEYPRTWASAFVEAAADWVVTQRGAAGVTLADLLLQWRQLQGRRWERSLDVRFVAALLEFERRPGAAASEFVSHLLGLGLLTALERDESRAEDAQSIREMRDAVTNGVMADATLVELGDRAFARNRIHVVTMHASKGLEFDVVCALGLEFTRLPRYKSAEWDILQQRRQFYVTVTRARKAVHLFYTGWTITRRNERWDHGPSPLIDELRLPPT